MTYVDPDLLADEVSVAEAILAGIGDRIPGWEPSEGSVETSLGEATGAVIAATNAAFKEGLRTAFVGMAGTILHIERRAEQVATSLTMWSAGHSDGVLIPAGSEAVGRNLDGEQVAFATLTDATIPPGETSVDNVPVNAVEAGPEGNGVTGAAEVWEPIDGITGVVFTIASAGGEDIEPIDEYAERAARRARQLRIVPIEERDYAELPLDIDGVARCLAVRLLNPADPPDPGDPPASGGHVTVFPIDALGEPVSAPVATQVHDLLAGGDRPLNVTVHVEEPTYTTVNVAMTVWLDPDVDEAAVLDAVEAALTDALSPALWAADPAAPGRWRKPTRDVERRVSAFDMAHAADSVPGVAGVDTCTVGGGAEVALPGFAPLPRPGAISVSVAS